MFGMQGWQLVIVVAVILLLFGAKRLPEMARGVGRSLKIFKAETKGLIDDKNEDDSVVDDTTAKSQAAPEAPARAVEPTRVETPADGATDTTKRDA